MQSSVVKLTRRATPTVISHDELGRVVRAGFGQRRKMLRRSLSELLSEDEIAAADVAPTDRAEQLDLAAWIRLATAVQPRS